MSNRNSSLDTLVELAREHRDGAAKLLGELRSSHQRSHQQLDSLLHYRDEYRRQFEAAMANGISMAALQNYQRFMRSLDQAIDHQHQQVTRSEGRVEKGVTDWQRQQQRVNAYDVLATRRLEEERLASNRREQRQTDEFASRASAAMGGF
ncbi:flagellar FliJ protein [Kushneria sinocarnis]|uniref:Flagellar FliJ protein n=1 Tax=Kushneria sinocarnis TaxID=595502 RepID=A0A420WXZ7_9GAMM|nr:flagellar export protein FliJ [Kushneria sinocarnis]RKR06099.1 flagellar FliJ protein [Kushneria sinocarnis]